MANWTAAGEWVRKARNARGYTSRDEFALAASVGRDTLRRFENGQQGPRGPQQSTIHGIEDALDVPPGTIRLVASGHENVPTDPDALTADPDHQVSALVQSLTGQLEQMAAQVSTLRSEHGSLAKRVAALESALPSKANGPRRSGPQRL